MNQNSGGPKFYIHSPVPCRQITLDPEDYMQADPIVTPIPWKGNRREHLRSLLAHLKKFTAMLMNENSTDKVLIERLTQVHTTLNQILDSK